MRKVQESVEHRDKGRKQTEGEKCTQRQREGGGGGGEQ